MKANRFGFIYLLTVTFAIILSLHILKTAPTPSGTEVIIPDEAIRLRILANSDSQKDQEIKHRVRDAVNAEISKWVENLTSIDEARNLIQERLPQIQKLAEQVVREHNVNHQVQVDFGMIPFPTKLYGEYLYPAGEYEAILVTIGQGKGSNWWCVLYPPLCFLDFSNGTAISPGFEEKPAPPPAKKKKPKAEKKLQKDQEEEQNESTPEQPEATEKETAHNNEDQAAESQTTDTPYETDTEMDAEKTDNEKEKNPEKQGNGSDKRAAKDKPEKPLFAEEDDEVRVKFFIAELFRNILK